MSGIDQKILNEFIEKGHFERHLNRMRKIYRDKHDLLLSELKGMEGQFKILGANVGLHLLLLDERGRSEEMLVRRAEAAGVKVYGLSEFCMENIPPYWSGNMVILGYASLSREQIREGVGLLKQAWKQEEP